MANWKKSEGFQVFPSTLQAETKKVIIHLENGEAVSSGTFHLLDMIGNTISKGILKCIQAGLWSFSPPTTLGNGYYRLQIEVKGDKKSVFRVVIGKQG